MRILKPDALVNWPYRRKGPFLFPSRRAKWCFFRVRCGKVVCAGEKLESVPQEGETPPTGSTSRNVKTSLQGRKKHCSSLSRVDVARSLEFKTDCPPTKRNACPESHASASAGQLASRLPSVALRPNLSDLQLCERVSLASPL